jgi:hypothetical protein
MWSLTSDFYYWQSRVCWCGALSLTRDRVCRLQMLLGLASAVILGSKSRRTRYNILLPQIWDSLNLEGHIPRIYIPQEPGNTVISPRHWVSFPSPPTTRRATVKVFDPSYMRVLFSLYSLRTDPHRKRRSIVGTCLPNHCIATVAPLTAYETQFSS